MKTHKSRHEFKFKHPVRVKNNTNKNCFYVKTKAILKIEMFISTYIYTHTHTHTHTSILLSVSHNTVYWIPGFLGCWVVLCGGWVPILKMEAARSSETFIPNHQTTRRNNPKNHEFYLHHRENNKFHTIHTYIYIYIGWLYTQKN
jgi:hypothetical protein